MSFRSGLSRTLPGNVSKRKIKAAIPTLPASDLRRNQEGSSAMISVDIGNDVAIEMTWAEYRQLLLKALRFGQAPEVLLRALIDRTVKH